MESLLAAFRVLTEDPEEDDVPVASKSTVNFEEVDYLEEEEEIVAVGGRFRRFRRSFHVEIISKACSRAVG